MLGITAFAATKGEGTDRHDEIKGKLKRESEEEKDGFVKVKPKTYEEVGKERFWPNRGGKATNESLTWPEVTAVSK